MNKYPRSNTSVHCYLIHFSRPLGHARHYIGMTARSSDIAERFREHCAGRGARITRKALERGIALELARVWEDVPRYTEQRLKNMGGGRRLCPICKASARIVPGQTVLALENPGERQ